MRRTRIATAAIWSYVVEVIDWGIRLLFYQQYVAQNPKSPVTIFLIQYSPWIILAIAVALTIWWILTPPAKSEQGGRGLLEPPPIPAPIASSSPIISGNTFDDCGVGIQINNPVSSHGQSGGVTAHSIGEVHQHAPADRTRFTRPLARFQVEGQRLLNDYAMAITAERIQSLASELGTWLQTTDDWIGKNMGETARAHFLNPGPVLDMAYPITGGHMLNPGQLANRRRNMTTVRVKLSAIEHLRTSGDYDPE